MLNLLIFTFTPDSLFTTITLFKLTTPLRRGGFPELIYRSQQINGSVKSKILELSFSLAIPCKYKKCLKPRYTPMVKDTPVLEDPFIPELIK